MADELFTLENGEWSMIRAEDSAATWHSKESIIPTASGFQGFLDHPVTNFKFLRSKVRYAVSHDPAVPLMEMPSKHVVLRSDNHQPVAVVGEDFNIVQPRQVVEFFQDLCASNHLKMDNVGIIRNGAKFWALARTGNEVAVGGVDIVKQYVLLATAVDGSMATTAKHTSLRTVCSNTLHQSLANGEASVKIRHSRVFDETEVKLELGLMDAVFGQFGEYANEMHKVVVDVADAQRWLVELLTEKNALDDEAVAEFTNTSRVFKGFWGGFTQGPGAEQTLWGLVNGVTYTVDHVRGRSFDTRFDSAQFGAGASLKKTAWDKAAALIEGIRAANDAMLVTAA